MTSVKPRPSAAPSRQGPSEFDILKQKHKFLREEEDEDSKEGGKLWDEAFAQKFYSNLWKEYALCDLKHYKSGNFALRWRTEAEVVSGAGESTCGNTRCKHHDPEKDKKLLFHTQPSSSRRKKESPNLNTLELPFGYVEDGQLKSALVKVVLCDKCVKKIMWKRRREKEAKELSVTSVHSAEEQDSQSDNEKGNSTSEARLEQGSSLGGVEGTERESDNRNTTHDQTRRKGKERRHEYHSNKRGDTEETRDKTDRKRRRSRSPEDQRLKYRKGDEGTRK